MWWWCEALWFVGSSSPVATHTLSTQTHNTPPQQEAKLSAERARKGLAKERDAALQRRAQLELDEKEAAGKLEAGAWWLGWLELVG